MGQLFGGAQREGGEPLVEGSFLERSNELRDQLNEQSERSFKRTKWKRLRATLVPDLMGHLSVHKWPAKLYLTASVGPNNESDWPVYPHIGRFSPCFPPFYKDEVFRLENDDEQSLGALLKWVNGNKRALDQLEISYAMGSMFDTIRRIL